MPRYVNLLPGDPAPRFLTRSTSRERYQFDTSAGRNIVLCFIGSANNAHGHAAIKAAVNRRDLFDDVHASFFGVSNDPADESDQRVRAILPGYRYFWDFDLAITRQYGASPVDEGDTGFVGKWVVVDPTLRVIAVTPFRPDGSDIAETLDLVASLPPPGRIAGMDVQAPVIVMDRVFEPDLCKYLISLYEAQTRDLSGFMRDIDGKTHLVQDASHKTRRDFLLENDVDIAHVQGIVRRRITPEIQKIHQFEVTRMERNLVACYAAEDEAHFRPHRDNTTKGTAHRRFAVSINLNDDFDGGLLSFPEYGSRTYKPSAGSAVIFSCSLLHAVSQVTRGKRYAFLPFLYDDAAARIREENAAFLVSQQMRSTKGAA